jgi:hypothetical protein
MLFGFFFTGVYQRGPVLGVSELLLLAGYITGRHLSHLSFVFALHRFKIPHSCSYQLAGQLASSPDL